MSASGAVIMSLFAAIWWLVGVSASGHGSGPMYGIPLAVTAGILVVALRRQRDPASESAVERRRQGRLVGIASGVEGLVIFLAINVLANVGRPDWAAPVIAIIVGLHFLPLARWLPARLYYLTGGLLVALGLLGFRILDPAARLLVVSVGAACVLWLTSAEVLRVSASPRERHSVLGT